MREKATLKAIWAKEDGSAERQQSLQTARLCAKLTKPYVLPDQGFSPGNQLQQNYQSLGAYGINNLEGELVAGLWPPLLPWFRFQPSSKIRFGGVMSPDQLAAAYQELWMRELQIQAVLESAGSRTKVRSSQSGFRAQKRKSISQLLITGDTLERMGDDYQIRVYRRDNYTTRRDHEGNVIFHMTHEILDPLTLTDRQIAAVGLKKDDLEGAHEGAPERCLPLITRVEWHPQTMRWVIEQECNDKIIPLGSLGNERDMASEEPISPYFSTPYDLSGSGSHYGRGFVEINCLADLRSLDSLTRNQLEWAGLASKAMPCIEESSTLTAEDLAQPGGYILRTRMNESGKPRDVGFLAVDKLQDFRMVEEVVSRIEARLSKVLLIASGSVRSSERTTAYEVQATTIRELDKSTSGMLPSIQDHQQLTLIDRTMYQLIRDGSMKKFEDGTVDLEILTGLAALVKSAKVQDLMSIATVAKDLGPDGLAKINTGALIDTLLRYMNLYEPNVVNTDEQVAAARARLQAEATQQIAAQQTIQTAGALVEKRANPVGAPA